MIDKADFRVPFSANFNPEFRFVKNELKYAGVSGIVRQSQHYQGTCDLRPFEIDAVLHLYFKRRGLRNHKLEILDAGGKSLEQIGQIISRVFDVDVAWSQCASTSQQICSAFQSYTFTMFSGSSSNAHPMNGENSITR